MRDDRDVFNARAYNRQVGRTAGPVNIGPQPRRVNGRDATALMKAAIEFRGTSINLHVVIGDNEASAFADEIEQLLVAMGWHVEASEVILEGRLEGFEARLSADDPSPGLLALALALFGMGFTGRGIANCPSEEPLIGLLIGHRAL